jgi:hypothetical protein
MKLPELCTLAGFELVILGSRGGCDATEPRRQGQQLYFFEKLIPRLTQL